MKIYYIYVFAKDFVLYDFHMDVPDYSYVRNEKEKPPSADTSIWFSFGSGGRMLEYGLDKDALADQLVVYALAQNGGISVARGNENPIRQDSLGHFIAALPMTEQDLDGDGAPEEVYDFARADLGPNAFNPAPQRFAKEQLPFELVFAERKYVMVYYENEILTDGEILVTSHNGEQKTYRTDSHGWIQELSNRDIREGFTASYSPDGDTVYRMHYALEDYPYFSPHFFAAHIPLGIIFALTAFGIVAVHGIRKRMAGSDPAYEIYSRERTGIYPGTLRQKTDSKFLLVRWLCLFSGMFLWTYAGKLIHQGQVLNEISIPVFSCPFNLDQPVEVPCYYLSHLPALFGRFGADFPIRNMVYAVLFLATTLFCFVFLGRVLCGFLCPAGLLQDLMDKLRQALHIRPIVVTDKMNRFLQPVKCVWIMNILVLNGSPRPKGNTKQMINAFREGAEAAGHTVDVVDVCKMKIGGCLACEYCHIREKGICVQKDDMQVVYNFLKKAEMLVIASPIYYHGISGQLKCVIDRFYCTAYPHRPPCLKKVAMILSSGDADMYEGALFSFKGDFLDYIGLENMGVFTAHGNENGSDKKLAELRNYGLSLK